MKTSLTLWAMIIFTHSHLYAQKIHPRSFLSGEHSAEQLSNIIQDKWNDIPTFSERSKWESLDDEIKTFLINKGESALNKEWSILSATEYMLFTDIGDRAGYEKLYFERRGILQDLVFAELVSGKGKYLKKIIEGIWLICEESSWSIPAHLYLQQEGRTPLPMPGEHVVDLFAAETGATLSWVYYLLQSPLDDVTPVVRQRIKLEIEERILIPNLERDDFWWMGFEDPANVNNWNPWINSNWINCIGLMEDDPQRKVDAIYKSMRSLDQFINLYPEDGGCDEGPSYWGRAGGSMFDYLEILYRLTEGKINIFDQQVIQNMASYIYKVNINEEYFVNFADAAAINHPPLELIFNWGELSKDKALKDFTIAKSKDFKSFYPSQSMNRQLRAIFSYDQIKNKKAQQPIVQDVWLEESEIYISRDYKNSVNGFFLAGKGGHNAESHNHNDVGNYIIYYNGKPIIIDIGVETYSAKTFSDQRYEIWTMQSQYHTLPIVNGIDQKNGRLFAAKHMTYNKNGPTITVSVNLEQAYPDEAHLGQWNRNITHRKGKFINIEENINLEEVTGNSILNFVTPCKVIIDDGQLFLEQQADGIPFAIKLLFDKTQLKPRIESIDVADGRLQSSWGNQLYRIQLELINPEKENKVNYSFMKK